MGGVSAVGFCLDVHPVWVFAICKDVKDLTPQRCEGKKLALRNARDSGCGADNVGEIDMASVGGCIDLAAFTVCFPLTRVWTSESLTASAPFVSSRVGASYKCTAWRALPVSACERRGD